jgi:hypothetical protein
MDNLFVFNNIIMGSHKKSQKLYAEVVTHIAGSLEAGGLPRYPESLLK